MTVGRLHQKTVPIFVQNNNCRSVLPRSLISWHHIDAVTLIMKLQQRQTNLEKVNTSLKSFYGFLNI